MLSKNIILLEEHLQVALLERCGRKIALTEEGEYIYEKWKDLIKNYCRENAIMRNIRHSVPEKFRVGFFPALALSNKTISYGTFFSLQIRKCVYNKTKLMVRRMKK